MRNEHDGSPQAVIACHELLAWIIPQLDKLPRVRRYTLGERIETGLLDVLERLIEAAYGSGAVKLTALQAANLRLGVVRHLWRLGHGLEAVSGKSYGYGAGLMEDLGRQLGGWQRELRGRGQPQ